jgi:hypothetical protein
MKMHSLVVLILIGLWLAWIATQEPTRSSSSLQKDHLLPPVKPPAMPPLPKMSRPITTPAREITQTPKPQQVPGFTGFGSIDGSGLGSGSGGNWLSTVQTL